MALSAPDVVARFESYPQRVDNWAWLDANGRVCPPSRASMARLTKRAGPGLGKISVLVDAADADRFLMEPADA